ncbi:MAG: tetratricopeptide repeat protein, partial [Candidatus Omnitrophota bacterium]
MQTARSRGIIKKRKRPYNVIAMAITVWSFLFKKIYMLITRAIKSGTILSGRNVVFGLSPGFYFRKSGYRPWFKTIALVLTGLFLINNLSWAYDGGVAIPSRDITSSGTAHVKQIDIDRLEIPLNFGNVKNKHKGANGKTIIHIQDAHCNYSCQKSIKGILNYLTSEYDIDLALLEGGAGDYDLSVFTDIEDKQLREKVADYFVKEGRVNGAEFFAITNPTRITLKGLENPNLYIKNLRVYRESLAYKDEIDKILNLLGHYLTNLKRHIYSRELKELDLKRADYNDKKIELNDYLGYLSDLSKKLNIDISTRKNLYRLIEVIEKEKNIDFKEANFERKRLIDELTKRLSSLELEALVKKSIHFKEGSIREIQFYSYLFKKAETVDFNVDTRYPNLSRYKKYIDIYESIDNWTLFNEIEKFEDDIVDRLCKNDAQKKLYILSKNLLLLKNLFNISLTTDRYKYYRENSHSLNIAHFLSFINTEAPKYKIKTNISEDIKALDIYREKIENFYKLAFKRDNVFIKNITSYMKKRDNLTVVTGGFHTENLEKLFKEKGYSYLTIMPNFENGDRYESPYFRLIAGKPNPIEEKINAIVNSTLAYHGMLNKISVIIGNKNKQVSNYIHRDWIEAALIKKTLVIEDKGVALDPDGNIVRDLKSLTPDKVVEISIAKYRYLLGLETSVAETDQSLGPTGDQPESPAGCATRTESFLDSIKGFLKWDLSGEGDGITMVTSFTLGVLFLGFKISSYIHELGHYLATFVIPNVVSRTSSSGAVSFITSTPHGLKSSAFFFTAGSLFELITGVTLVLLSYKAFKKRMPLLAFTSFASSLYLFWRPIRYTFSNVIMGTGLARFIETYILNYSTFGNRLTAFFSGHDWVNFSSLTNTHPVIPFIVFALLPIVLIASLEIKSRMNIKRKTSNIAITKFPLAKQLKSPTITKENIRQKASEDDNVTCGTVCRSGHEECIDALDRQLEEFYENLAREAGITRNLKTNPLTSEEIISALLKTGTISYANAGLLNRVRAHLGGMEKKGIQILFAIPKDKTKLWWVKDPKTGEWTYAGGHFNAKGTRIHISIPLILAQNDPEKAAEAIAIHDYKHIRAGVHDEDEGMRIVARAAVLGKDWENVIERRVIMPQLLEDENNLPSKFIEEKMLIRQTVSSIVLRSMFDEIEEAFAEIFKRIVLASWPDRIERKEQSTIKNQNSFWQWIKREGQNIAIILTCLIGITILLPRLILKLKEGKRYTANIQQKKHEKYNKKRIVSQIVDPSLAPKPRHEETIIKKFPKNWNSDIDLSVAKTAGIGGTFPWEASLANETVVAEVEGKIYGPLFKTIAFNFKSNGEIVPPADLNYIPVGTPNGTTGTFKYQMNAEGKNSVEPVTHLRGIINPASVKIRALDKNGALLSNKDIAFSLKNGRIIEFDYKGRVRIELTIVNYSDNIMLDYTQAPLPENELRDFPDAFAIDIIKYIREGLARYEGLFKKFVKLVDVDGMTLREKLDAIADPEKSHFIPKNVKLQAIVNVMNKYCLINPRNARMQYNGISWGSTWDGIISSEQKIRVICNTLTRMFIILCQRVGLQAGYVSNSGGLARKGNFIIKGEIPHAMAVVKPHGTWKLVETTLLAHAEGDIVTSSGGSVFEGEAEYIPSAYVFDIKPDNHKEEQEVRTKDIIMQKIEELKRKKNKGSAGWWLNLGKNYYRAGYWDEAINCFTKGFRLKPYMIRDAYCRHGFIQACRKKGKHITAIEYIEDYLPDAQDIEQYDLWSIWDDLESLYRDIEDKERAIKFLEDFIEEHPEDKLAWGVLGQIYPMRAGDKGIEKTIRFLNKFLQKHPHNSKAGYALRKICIQENNIDASIQEIKKLLEPRFLEKLRPFWLYEVLGELYVQKDMPDKALEAYKHIAEIYPGDTELWKRAGFKLYHKGHFEHSIEALEKALEFEANQNDADLWKRLGFAHKKTKNYNQAIEAYRKALDISVSIEVGEYPRIYVIYDLVDIYKDHATDGMDEAINYFTAVSKNNPEEFRATMALAKLYKLNKKYDEAINAYKKGMKAMFDKSYYRNDEVGELAQIYFQCVPEKIDEGISYFEGLSIEYPECSAISNNLAQLYVEKKLFDKAITLHRDWITRMLNEKNRYAEYNAHVLVRLYVTHRKNMINEGMAYFKRLLKRVSDDYKDDIIFSIARLYMGKQDFSNALLYYRKVIAPLELENQEEPERAYEKGYLITDEIQTSLRGVEKKSSNEYENDDVLRFIDCLIGAKEYREAKIRCVQYLKNTRAEYYYDFARGWERLSDIYKGLGKDKNAELAKKYYREYIKNDTPVLDKKELEEILKKFDEADDSEIIKEKEGTANVTCGTICQAGHQELFDPQFERYYRGLARDANIKKKILDSNDVISALEKTGKLQDLGTTKEQLREIIEYIHQEAAIPDNIQILFGIPENNSKLWWIEDPETGELLYAGGHFNGEGTRIHISLPLILSQANPRKAALAIARHDYSHIREKKHHEDEGMRIVRKTAESEKKNLTAKRTKEDFHNQLLKVLESAKVDENSFPILLDTDLDNLAHVLNRINDNKLDQAFLKKVIRVFCDLYAVPDIRAREIMSHCRINKNELLKIFEFIRNSDILQELFSRHPIHQGFFHGIRDFLSSREHIQKMLDKEKVFPLSLEVHPSAVCDKRCETCFNIRHLYYDEPREKLKPLTVEEWEALVNNAADNGLKKITVSGGLEPLHQTAIEKTIAIMKTATKRNLETRLFTHGNLVDTQNQKLIDTLLEIDEVYLSLKATTPEVYKKVVGLSEKHLEKGMEAAKYLVEERKKRDSKLKVNIAFLINPNNFKELPALFKFAKETRIDSIGLSIDFIRGLAGFSEENKKELGRMVKQLKDEYEGIKVNLDNRLIALSYAYDKELPAIYQYKLRLVKNCQVAQLQPAINPFGKVYDCCFIVNPAIAGSFEPLGHITEGRSLEDIMREKQEHVRDATKCSSCNSWVLNQIGPYAKLENDYREGISLDAQPFRISPISADVPFIDEPDNSEFAKGKDSPNRFARVLIQKGPYRDFVQFLSEEAMDGYLGFR